MLKFPNNITFLDNKRPTFYFLLQRGEVAGPYHYIEVRKSDYTVVRSEILDRLPEIWPTEYVNRLLQRGRDIIEVFQDTYSVNKEQEYLDRLQLFLNHEVKITCCDGSERRGRFKLLSQKNGEPLMVLASGQETWDISLYDIMKISRCKG